MNTAQAIKQLSRTIRNKYKPSAEDADALNQLIININNSTNNTDRLCTIMYGLLLQNFIARYADIDIATTQLNKNILQWSPDVLKGRFETTEINNLFKSKGIMDWSGKHLNEIVEIVNANKRIMNKIEPEELVSTYEMCSEENVMFHVKRNVNELICLNL